MNSNNLELSLIENEIEKISSKYHLKGNQVIQSIHLAPQVVNQEFQQQDLNKLGMKSPSVVSFGGTQFNNQTQQAILQQQIQQQANPLQEVTLNKQGKIPTPKDQKPQGQNNMPKINPKDLSNEELEYIIKTGKLPPRVNVLQQNNTSINNNIQNINANLNYQQQQQIQQQTQQQFTKTSQNHAGLQSIMGTQTNTNFSSKHPSISAAENKENNQDFQQYFIVDQKNYNSPRMMNEYQNNKQQPNMQQPTMQPLQLSQLQPIQPLLPIVNPQNYDKFSQPQLLPSSNSFQMLDSSQYSKNLETSQLNQSTTSQAASHALKALQDKIKSLENQNQLLEDKLQITESTSQDTIKRLQLKLKEETERSNIRESQLKEEINLLKKQVETVETEKLRHLEENSSERDLWRQQFKKLEDENLRMKQELKDQIERYSGIEDCIQDIKRREQLLRDKYEKELHQEKEKSQSLLEEVTDTKKRYDQLKDKLRQRNKQLEQENQELKEDLQKTIDRQDNEFGKLQRELQKWKRECQMLKEEISIIGEKPVTREKETMKTKSILKKSVLKEQSQSKVSTPKYIGDMKQNQKRCYSPVNDDKSKTQIIEQSNNFQSIEQQDNNIQKIHKHKSKRRESKKNSHKKNISASQHNNVSSLNRENTIGVTSNQSASKKRMLSSERKKNDGKSQKIGSSLKKLTKENEVLKNSKVRTQKSSSRHRPEITSNKKSSNSRPRTDRSLNGVQSQQNLISINTKIGKAENVVIDDKKEHTENKRYILIDGQKEYEPKRTLSAQRLDDTVSVSQSIGPQNNNKFNHYKRGSIESTTSQVPYGLSQTSDMGGLMYSHQTSMDNQDLLISHKFNVNTKPLEIGDFNNEKNIVDNEIFYLEREIFDYNQQYKSLLTQQTNSASSYQPNVSQDSNNQAFMNQKLRQIAQMLEEKSEKLFDLKRQQQQLLLKESYQEKNPFAETGIKLYQQLK